MYARLTDLARTALAGGHAVVCDAVFARTDDRQALAQTAAALGVPFQAVWLDAPLAIRAARVAARRNDASDATAAIVQDQQSRLEPPADWSRIDASGEAATTLERVRRGVGSAS